MSYADPENPLRIHWRVVHSDVNVGPWKLLNEYPQDKRHNIVGLRAWMAIDSSGAESWDPEQLRQIAFDPHIWDYGSNLQFWVPIVEERESAPAQRPGVRRVKCVDSVGCEDCLTEGAEYTIIVTSSGLFMMQDDSGETREFLSDRFVDVE